MKAALFILITALSLCGQTPNVTTGTGMTNNHVVFGPNPINFELSGENKEKIRIWQLEWDEIEIANQKALLQVEQNKAHQLQLTDAIRTVAYEHAVANKIDLSVNEIDSRLLKFVPIKKKP